MSNEDVVREHIEKGVAAIGEEAVREFAEEVRDQYLKNLDENIQGEEGLKKYVTEVKQARNPRGEFISMYEFDVEHPTAKLHERGGPIEPTYGRAMSQGWTRDGFYDALKDCEYEVRKKRHLKNATTKVMSDRGDVL